MHGTSSARSITSNFSATRSGPRHTWLPPGIGCAGNSCCTRVRHPREMERLERMRELLAPWGRPQDMQIERHAVYRFHARTVDCFQKGNVFLAGDAAHVTPPFIG